MSLVEDPGELSRGRGSGTVALPAAMGSLGGAARAERGGTGQSPGAGGLSAAVAPWLRLAPGSG